MAAAKRVYKTKRKVTGGQKSFRAWKEWKEGDYIIGEYVGKSKDAYKKMSRHIKVEEAQFEGKAKTAKSLIGKVLVLNANGMVDKAFDGDEESGREPIETGEIVKVEYRGMEKLTKGKFKGKDSHRVDVEVMEVEGEPSEDDIEGEEEEEIEESEESEESEEENDDSDEDGEEEEEEEYDL